MPLSRPAATEFPPDSLPAHYISLVKHDTVSGALREQKSLLMYTFRSVPGDKLLYRYAPRKWSLLEMLGHIIDTERIMCYRALCIARGERQSLPGFDENAYVETAGFADRSLDSLLEEYRLQREANILMAEHLTESGLLRLGKANNHSFSARAFLWLVAGHELHHLAILNERYLT